MSTQAVVTEEPKVEAPPVEAPNPRKFSKTIPAQLDGNGNTLAVAQTFYGATEQELIDNLAKAQEHATARIRDLARKTTLEQPSYSVPEGADAFEDIPLPKPRELTQEERTALSAQITNPETMVDAYRKLHTATSGMTPEESARLEAMRARDTRELKSRENALAFMQGHPEFVPCPENAKVLKDYFESRHIGATLKNFELAFKELSASGLLVLKTKEDETAEVPVPPEPPAAPIAEVRIEQPVEQPAPQPVIPSALTSRSASGGGAPARKKGPTAQELAMMSADELRKHYESIGQWPTSAKAIR